ncbi:MAG: helix-turn-helix transcriptional regulator [bacterium]|nr:helix-turn-helix transcriptional regulator [bacterium]
MSHGDIARALDVCRAYASGIENGKRNPTLATIQKLADALGVLAHELIKRLQKHYGNQYKTTCT